MSPPTAAQSKGVAFAHIPFAIISVFASAYVIYYHLFQKDVRHKKLLDRMYHRLVLAMNLAIFLLSLLLILEPFAIPEGSQYFAGAKGTAQTCTASGFIFIVLNLTIPIYYSSLSLQAFMGIKNNFDEEKYRWTEKYIHLVAWLMPIAISTVLAVTENINPSGAGCFAAKHPLECETNPDVPCERGQDLGIFELVVGFCLMFIYFIFTPSMVIAVYCWMNKVQKNMGGSQGMAKLRLSARKEMMKNVVIQLSVYLFSFLITWVFIMISAGYRLMAKGFQYDLLIFGQCMHATQGFVFAMVYFTLQRMGTTVQSVRILPASSLSTNASTNMLTVEDIRLNAERKPEISGSIVTVEEDPPMIFNIFDGTTLDESSPWARFIDNDDYSDNPDCE